MSEPEKPTIAFILSLIGGIFILLGGGMMSMMGSYFGSYGFGMMGRYGGYGGYRGWGGMMGYGYPGIGYGMMGGLGLFGILGLIFGVIVIISAVRLNQKPQEHRVCGTLIVVFSVLSIFGGAMGGLGIGLILGVIGGVIAITWKSKSSS